MSNGSSIFDKMLGIGALVTAVAAAVGTIYEANAVRRHQELSVWPRIQHYNSYSAAGETESGQTQTRFYKILENQGMGPAVIESFRVTVDGVAYQNWPEVFEALGIEGLDHYGQSTVSPKRVIRSNEQVSVLELIGGAPVFALQERRDDIVLTTCYCSIYEDCWVVEHYDPPRTVKECRNDPATYFTE